MLQRKTVWPGLLAVLVGATVLAVSTLAGGQPIGLTEQYMSSYPFTVKTGTYNLRNFGPDILAPGGKVPPHYHSGPAVITVIDGELVRTEGGKEQIIRVGEGFMENPNSIHAVENRGTAPARFQVCQLIPMGAPPTTFVK